LYIVHCKLYIQVEVRRKRMANCSNCGAELKPAAKFCSECGAALSEAAYADTVESANFSRPEAVRPAPIPDSSLSPAKIENNLVKSIIATACCIPFGIPFGIVGIVYAVKVDALLKQGRRADAEEAGKKAGIWSNLSIGIGLVIVVMYFLIIVMSVADRAKDMLL